MSWVAQARHGRHLISLNISDISEYICRYLNISTDISEYIWYLNISTDISGRDVRSKKRGVSDNRFASQGEHRLLHCFHFPPHQQCTGTEQLYCFHFHSNLACKPCSINCVKALHHQCTAAAFTTDLIPALHCWLPLVSAMLVAFHVFLTQCNRSRCVKAGLNVDEFLRPKGCLVALLWRKWLLGANGGEARNWALLLDHPLSACCNILNLSFSTLASKISSLLQLFRISPSLLSETSKYFRDFLLDYWEIIPLEISIACSFSDLPDICSPLRVACQLGGGVAAGWGCVCVVFKHKFLCLCCVCQLRMIFKTMSHLLWSPIASRLQPRSTRCPPDAPLAFLPTLCLCFFFFFLFASFPICLCFFHSEVEFVCVFVFCCLCNLCQFLLLL